MSQPVVFFEIGCRDSGKTGAFFTEMFGWKLRPDGSSLMLEHGEEVGGIPGHIVANGHEPHNYTIFYVQVEDLKTSLDQAVSLGGKVCLPPVEIPGSGTFALINDPEGNTIGLWKPL
jgi:uncharacterized protein